MATAKRSGAAALPVRPGEKHWTGAELDKVRAELEAEVAELRTNIDQATVSRAHFLLLPMMPIGRKPRPIVPHWDCS